jgi:hypothetical protein
MATGFDGIERALVILESHIYTIFVGTYSVLLRLLGIASLLELLPYFLFFTFRVLSIWSIKAMSSLLSFHSCYVRFCVEFLNSLLLFNVLHLKSNLSTFFINFRMKYSMNVC